MHRILSSTIIVLYATAALTLAGGSRAGKLGQTVQRQGAMDGLAGVTYLAQSPHLAGVAGVKDFPRAAFVRTKAAADFLESMQAVIKKMVMSMGRGAVAGRNAGHFVRAGSGLCAPKRPVIFQNGRNPRGDDGLWPTSPARGKAEPQSILCAPD
jgi:hypothetical protein